MLEFIDIKYFKLIVGEDTKDTDVDIAVKCPFCGDSKIHKNSKRLHLYEKNGTTLVHCFNGGCGIHNNVYNFIKNYKPEYLFSYKQEKFSRNVYNIKENQINSNFDTGLKVDLEIDTNFKYFDLDFVFEDPKAEILILKYLAQRSLNYEKIRNTFGDFYIGSKDFLKDGRFLKIKNNLIVPFFRNNRAYGFYSRGLQEKRFCNFSLNPGYNIWNFFNVDLEEDLYIFEGIFDALSFYQLTGIDNIIALNTASVSFEIFEKIKKPILMLDNDSAGFRGMLKFIKYDNARFGIFNSKYKDFNEMLIHDDINYEVVSNIKAMILLKSRL